MAEFAKQTHTHKPSTVTLLRMRRGLTTAHDLSTGPAETVGQVGHLPYHFLVVHTGNDVYYDLYPR